MARRQNRGSGFGNRPFLTQEEWETYGRRMAVRYIPSKLKGQVCTICGRPAEDGNPLQNAHRIGFYVGVLSLGLTPDFLDRPENIVTSHQKYCNRKSELSLLDSMKMLKQLDPAATLPAYLPDETRRMWDSVR